MHPQRLPRETFEKKLRAIIGLLEETPEREVRWRDTFLNCRYSLRFRVQRLWVAGSWVRGAADCGDLDLVAQVEVLEQDGYINHSAIAKSIRARRRYVEVHVGTPDVNSSRVVLPGAMLVWSADADEEVAGPDDIAVDPSAGRFARAHDSLPFSLDRLILYRGFAEAQRLVDAIANGHYSSMFVAAESLDGGPITPWLTQGYEQLSRRAGRRTARVLRDVVGWLGTLEHVPGVECFDSATSFRVRGYQVAIGAPPVDTGLLDRMEAAALVVAPHYTSRGPNGIWVLRPGPNHPLAKLFADICVWTNGVCEYGMGLYGPTAHGTDLYATRQQAAEEDPDADDEGWLVEFRGTKLFGLLADLDLIYFGPDRTELALSSRGHQYIAAITNEPTPEVTARDPVACGRWLRRHLGLG